MARKTNPLPIPKGKWIKVNKVKVNRNGSVTLAVPQSSLKKNPARKKRNVEAGFWNATGFHPLRSSFDYDPVRADDEYGDYGSGVKSKKRKKKAKSKAKGRRR